MGAINLLISLVLHEEATEEKRVRCQFALIDLREGGEQARREKDVLQIGIQRCER